MYGKCLQFNVEIAFICENMCEKGCESKSGSEEGLNVFRTLLELLAHMYLGKLSKLKSGESWETVQSGDDPSGVGAFLNLGLF